MQQDGERPSDASSYEARIVRAALEIAHAEARDDEQEQARQLAALLIAARALRTERKETP